ncbi:MAG: hypothetical protein ACFFC7_18725 [Candidatus Hermodarchaeota archaeon]
MIQVATMEDERLLFNIITPDTPPQVKQIIYDAIEAFEEQRSI